MVRYADTNGYERDAAKPHAWRYRDYVIRAFNADKPYDRFVLEQIAGDELPDADGRDADRHRLPTGWARGTTSRPTRRRTASTSSTTSSARPSQAFLGLTLGCARCHDHKFEPLTQHDYYRMVAVFDPLTGPANGRTELDLPTGTRGRGRGRWPSATGRSPRSRADRSLRDAGAAVHLADGRASSRPSDRGASAASSQRTEAQKKLGRRYRGALSRSARRCPTRPSRVAIAAGEESLRRATPDLPRGYFLREPSASAPATHLLLRGKADAPGAGGRAGRAGGAGRDAAAVPAARRVAPRGAG